MISLTKVALVVFCSLSLVVKVEPATEFNRYLAHIFQKYGDGNTMSFEGFEHLMFSLGLGQIEFDPDHTIDQHRPDGMTTQPDPLQNEAYARRFFQLQKKNIFYSDESTEILNGPTDSSPNKDQKLYLTQEGEKEHSESSHKNHKEDRNQRDVILEFKELHDPKHSHPRENKGFNSRSSYDSSNVCLSPKSLLNLVFDHNDLHKRKLYQRLFGDLKTDNHDIEDEYNKFVNNVKITPVTFMKLCPALLAQIDQHVCVRPAPFVQSESPNEQLWNAWIYATGSISVLSACGLLGILLVPLMKTAAYSEILKFLIAVAAGTLGGDALMHLLPHAIKPEGDDSSHHDEHLEGTSGHHGHDNANVYIFGCAFAVGLLMFVLENLLPILKGEQKGGHGHSHGHGNGHGPSHKHKHNNNENLVNSQQKSSESLETSQPTVKEINVMLNETKIDMKAPVPPLTPVAFMVIIGDGLHNLTDGLAIGAAFASDPVTGLATAVAVLCHELPHELGDFALLLQSGLPLRRVLCLNIVSSVLSFLGMAIGLLIAGLNENITRWIYAGTAGSFLYIAFADIIPAMSNENDRSLKGFLIQAFGIAAGGVLMLVIAIYEESLEQLFS